MGHILTGYKIKNDEDAVISLCKECGCWIRDDDNEYGVGYAQNSLCNKDHDEFETTKSKIDNGLWHNAYWEVISINEDPMQSGFKVTSLF